MKSTKIMLAGAFVAIVALTSCNQVQTTSQTKERVIEVSGSAEKEVIPDEVYFTLTVQEYKKNGKKVSLDQMEKTLVDRALAIGIKKEDLKLDNLTAYSYNYYYGYDYGYYHKRNDVMATGTYRIKLKNTGQMDKLLENKEGINVTYAHISNFACSDKEKYNEELREKALRITREKATKMLAALGAELGEVLTITDGGSHTVNNQSYYPYGYYYGTGEERQANSLDVNTTASTEPAVSPRNIRLRAEMRVVYRIK